MGLMRASLPGVLRKLLTIGAAVCVAGAAVTAVGVPAAQGASGGTIEHWGAYGTKGKQHDKVLSPSAVTLPAPVAQVASSNSTQYALLTNGTVWALGLGTYGELGNGGTTSSLTTPVKVKFPAGVKIAFIPTDVMPYDSAFAVDTTGHVWAWGDNAGGEFCLGNTTEYNTPVELQLSDVTTLAGAANHATYDAGGTLYSCGSNQYGELGNGNKQSSTTPVQVTGLNGQSVTTLVAAWGNTGALLSNGDYYDWGFDGEGQIGNGTINDSADTPVQVTLPGPVTQAAQGGSVGSNGQTLVLLSDGSLYAWGAGTTYQLGDGKKANEESPEHILPPSGVTYQALATGGNTSYGITTAGAVYAWGASNDGQVGDGTTTTAKTPVQVETGATQISSTASDVVTNADAG
jgi:alpha-tubulin suppressor-like RCC1 family protein